MSELTGPERPQRDLEGGIVAHGKKFDFKDKSHVRMDLLELIPWAGRLPQLIVFETAEFSAVCPFSGLPDIARLTVEYVPSEAIVELRSWKYAITSFHGVGVYQEEATDLIAKAVQRYLQPKWFRVTTVYNTRGGYDTTATVEMGDRALALKGE